MRRSAHSLFPRAVVCSALLLALVAAGTAGAAPIVVGGDGHYPPYEFLDEQGAPSGFNVELTEAIAAVMGLEVEVRLGAWGQMRRGLLEGEVDILQGMVTTAERLAQFDFSPPHAVVHQAIWNRKGHQRFEDLEQLDGREVIVMRGSVMHEFMLERKTAATLILTDSLAEALRTLASGRHDCALVAKLPGQYLVNRLGLSNIAPVAAPLLAQDYGYAVSKGRGELLAQFADGLAILKATGQYREIRNRWLGVLEEPEGIPWRRVLTYGAWVVGPLLLVLAGTVLWNRTLKKEVAHRTAALEREVAERRRAARELELRQRQLIQADKMTSLGILVSGVAHEVNNPNGVIMLNLPLLHKAYLDAVPILEERYREQGDFKLGWLKYSRMRGEIPGMFEESLESARRIKRIVEDLKDFARRDDSDLSARVDLNGSVRTALRLVEPTIRKATRNFSFDPAEGLPPVRGNAQRLEQVVVNLVLNACQALEDTQQAITLSTHFDSAQGEVVLEVRDQGRGVDPQQLEHLTDPFFTTKREAGGTGLGLSVSAGIVREHGGSLAFDSVPGKGMTVRLALPASKEEAS